MIPLFLACATINVDALSTNEVYADDGEVKKESGAVQFAVLGGVRPAVPTDAAAQRVATPQTEEQVLADLSAQIQEGQADFIVLTGDLVAQSTTSEWKRFTKAWSPVIAGTEPPQAGRMRVRTVPVAGETDRAGDLQLLGFGASFPGVGQDIGYNRVASWYAFDVVSRKTSWRIMVLDSDKEALGSRWDEQLAWMPKALEGDYHGLLVVMHHPRHTLAKGQVSDDGGGASALLDEVDAGTRIGVLKAVFAGRSHTNEVFVPNGKFGEMYVNAGGAGAPADHQLRWGKSGDRDIALEPIFDTVLVRQFDGYAEARKAPESAVEKARSSGSFEGFAGEYDAAVMPIQGWWQVELDGTTLNLGFRMVQPDGTVKTVYTTTNDAKEGWLIGKGR